MPWWGWLGTGLLAGGALVLGGLWAYFAHAWTRR